MRPLSIFAWFGYELKLEDSFRRIRAAGFDEVFLWWGEFEGDIPLREQPGDRPTAGPAGGKTPTPLLKAATICGCRRRRARGTPPG